MSEIDFSGRKITARTLTVQQVRELLDEIKKQSDAKSILDLNVVDLLFDDDVPAIAVSKSTGLTLQELCGPVDPQLVRNVIDEVRAANPFFVGMMERMVNAGKSGGQVPATSSLPSAS